MGIDLYSATRLVIFDVPFNPVHNQQAVHRIYRIGQTKPTFVYRLIYKGTFEESQYQKCVEKEELFAKVG